MSVETRDYAAMLRRMVRAYGGRLAMADPDDLANALGILGGLEAQIGRAICELQQHGHVTWADVGDASGTSRQAAQQRWSKHRHIETPSTEG